MFLEDVGTNVYPIVRIDPHDVGVVGGVVDLAHGDAVGDDRFAALGIGSDVCCVQELEVAQVSYRAAAPIRRQHPSAEQRLVEPIVSDSFGVHPPERGVDGTVGGPSLRLIGVQGHDELL